MRELPQPPSRPHLKGKRLNRGQRPSLLAMATRFLCAPCWQLQTARPACMRRAPPRGVHRCRRSSSCARFSAANRLYDCLTACRLGRTVLASGDLTGGAVPTGALAGSNAMSLLLPGCKFVANRSPPLSCRAATPAISEIQGPLSSLTSDVGSRPELRQERTRA